MNKPSVLLIRAGLMFSFIGISLYSWLGKGAEANCGTSMKPITCYLPGADWLIVVMAISFCLIFVSFIVLSNINK